MAAASPLLPRLGHNAGPPPSKTPSPVFPGRPLLMDTKLHKARLEDAAATSRDSGGEERPGVWNQLHDYTAEIMDTASFASPH